MSTWSTGNELSMELSNFTNSEEYETASMDLNVTIKTSIFAESSTGKRAVKNMIDFFRYEICSIANANNHRFPMLRALCKCEKWTLRVISGLGEYSRKKY